MGLKNLRDNIRYLLVFLESFFTSSVGYSPTLRDGILDIENRLLCWILDIPCWILDIEFGCGYAALCSLCPSVFSVVKTGCSLCLCGFVREWI
jgi:hypothetical protein